MSNTQDSGETQEAEVEQEGVFIEIDEDDPFAAVEMHVIDEDGNPLNVGGMEVESGRYELVEVPKSPSEEDRDVEQSTYNVGVEHTDTLTGAPDLTKVQVMAESEDKAVEYAKKKTEWPEERFYDEEDIGVREV